MALETASYINNLVATNPLGSDPLADADGHIRLIKSTLQATFPNISGPVTATQAALNSPFPTGGIIIWSGAIAAVPSGWLLCDGGSGTPDLRDRFVVGAGLGYVVGATGGNVTTTLTTANLPSHSHTFSGTTVGAGGHSHSGVTDTHGGHAHTYQRRVGLGGGGGNDQDAGGFGDFSTGVAGAHAHGLAINAVGDHTHTISGTTGAVGSAAAIENRPPYYALAYIMKI